ncbi:MAG: type I-E CRISPR-associated protein Cse2/CasB [Truepera sp.]|nr:type I-E CRISPR-associated protein Cse2/CasB [Truepera sp.]
MSQQFIERLSKLDRGARARLRRNLQQDSPYPNREAMRYVEDFVQQVENPVSWERRAYYLVAGFYALRYPDPLDSPTEGVSFAEAAAQVVRLRNRQQEIDSSKESSLERRFFHLLEAERDELPYHLRQWIGLMKAAGVQVDFAKLLSDIIYWNECTKDTWARAFYRALRSSLQITEISTEEVPR